MKKLILLIILLFLVGCAASPVIAPAPQKVIIEVVSGSDSKVAVEEGQKTNRSMEVHNPEGELSGLTFICNRTKRAYTKLFSGLSVSDVTKVWNDICWLENNTDIREVHMFINSPGGDAFQGMALSDQIERARRQGFKIIAHASGIIASAAVPVLAVCRPRYAAPGTIFMVHEAALWKWPGRETASQIRSQHDLMKLLQMRYIKKLVDNTNLPESEWKAMEKETTWFDADKAMDWGLVDEIE